MKLAEQGGFCLCIFVVCYDAVVIGYNGSFQGEWPNMPVDMCMVSERFLRTCVVS